MTLVPGTVLTVEPGLYVSDRLPVPEDRWKGIGIRIEDDLAVTERGHENLTAAALKAAVAMER